MVEVQMDVNFIVQWHPQIYRRNNNLMVFSYIVFSLLFFLYILKII